MRFDRRMGDEGPYRQSQGVTCPACATVLLDGKDGARSCPRGCGEWFARRVVDERWGHTVTIDGDPRLKWRVGGTPAPCPVCKQKMTRVVHQAWQSQRCDDHGVWFVRDARAQFERELADDIAVFLRGRDAVDRERRDAAALEATLAELLERVATGDRIAMRALARRLLALEARVAELEAALPRQ